jgi:Ca-activated chloride channel family protein
MKLSFFFCILSERNCVVKTACQILFFLLFSSSVYTQQFYVRGVVKDETGNVLQNVTILQHKTGYLFKSGSEGTFGIATNLQIDTFSFSLDGYVKEKIIVNADNYVNVKLKKLSGTAASSRRDKLASLTKNLLRVTKRMPVF